MTSLLNADEEFVALLAEIRNAIALNGAKHVLQNETFSAYARLSQIPSELLAALHTLAPKATKSACSLLDMSTEVVALVCDTMMAFTISQHTAVIGGLELHIDEVLQPCLQSENKRSACDCPSFVYGSISFCKHIIAAGLAAAVGIATVSHVNHATMSAQLKDVPEFGNTSRLPAPP